MTGGEALLLVVAAAAGLACLYPTLATFTRGQAAVSWPLVLRKLPSKGETMLAGHRGHNVFAEEFNDLFLTTVHILDHAVMKYVRDCRILSKQEQAHARMHLEGMRASAPKPKRHVVLAALFDLLLLRMGQRFGAACALAVETVAGPAFYSLGRSGVLNDWESDLTLFHMFEEVEHGPLTVQSLRKRSSLPFKLLAFVPMFLLTVIFFLLPPVLKLVGTPLLFLRRPLAIVDLVTFYATFIPAFLMSNWMLIAYFLSPVAVERHQDVAAARDHFQERIARRGLRHEVVDSEAYPLWIRAAG